MPIAWALPLRCPYSLRRHSMCIISRFTSSQPYANQPRYISPVDAKPVHRYQQGGYHSISLGDYLKDGRYKVVHKLGWGGYSTVWAARDRMLKDVYVAIKIGISKRRDDGGMRELHIMKELTCRHVRLDHIVYMLDFFDLEGPNGIHTCIVYELLGSNLRDMIDAHSSDGRLPGKLAKSIAKQTLIGLDTLHQLRIGHGDLHSRNLAFHMPGIHNLTEDELAGLLGKPEIGHVRRSDGDTLEPGVPEYIVRPALYPTQSWSSSIRIIDFGEFFSHSAAPHTLHTPLCVRAPEVIFRDSIDYRVDLWSLGCLLFELFVGQPPFDSFLTTSTILVGQMQEMASDVLPERWHKSWNRMKAGDERCTKESFGQYHLQEWLGEVYFDNSRKQGLTREDIVRLGCIIGSLLKFEPSARAPARDILDDSWFDE